MLVNSFASCLSDTYLLYAYSYMPKFKLRFPFLPNAFGLCAPKYH